MGKLAVIKLPTRTMLSTNQEVVQNRTKLNMTIATVMTMGRGITTKLTKGARPYKMAPMTGKSMEFTVKVLRMSKKGKRLLRKMKRASLST